MKFLSQRPDLICAGAMLVLVALGLPLLRHNAIDVQLYDTYYAIKYHGLSVISGFAMVFYAVIYSIFRRSQVPLVSTITMWQLLLTIGGLLFLTLLFLFNGTDPDGIGGRAYYVQHEITYGFIISILVGLGVVAMGFALMIANVIIGLVRRTKTK